MGCGVLPESIELLAFAAASLVFALAFAPALAPRRALAVQGGAGLAGTAAVAAAPAFDLAGLGLMLPAGLQAAGGGKRPFAARLKAPGAGGGPAGPGGPRCKGRRA